MSSELESYIFELERRFLLGVDRTRSFKSLEKQLA